ncbi:MAG: hypothetical protein AABY27_01525 [Pseudomonadota bacterium]
MARNFYQVESLSQENILQSRMEEIEKLEKLIDDSLAEIESLRVELKDLEQDLNSFLDNYYGSGSIFFKNTDPSSCQADNDNGHNLEQAKKNLYAKIAKVCSQDSFSNNSNLSHDNLLKIEGYLTEGSDQSKSPHDLLSNLIFEYYGLMQQMRELKTRKQSLLESPAYELKQEIMWANIKTTETISKIRDNLVNHANRLH